MLLSQETRGTEHNSNSNNNNNNNNNLKGKTDTETEIIAAKDQTLETKCQGTKILQIETDNKMQTL